MFSIFKKNKLPDYEVKLEEVDHVFPNKPLSYYQTPVGNYFLPNYLESDIVINTIKQGKVFEKEIVKEANHHIIPGTAVLDIGANFGQMAVFFSKSVGPDGLVYAFEADDFIFHVLEKNIKANGCNNISAFCKAVYNTTGRIVFYPEQDLTRFSSLGSYGIDPNATSGREVETISIDSLKIEKKISFMKVDVQGADLAVLQGAKATIEKHKMPVIFEFEEQFQTEYKTCFQDYLDFIESIGYKIQKKILGINLLIVPK